MSNLAPFVAAAIRDKVVVDQQHEINALSDENQDLRHQIAQQQRRMQEMDPMRQLELKSAGGNVLHVSQQINIEEVLQLQQSEPDEVVLPLFEGHEDLIIDTFHDFLQCEIWVDGSKALSLSDMVNYGNLSSMRWFMCCLSENRSIQCRLTWPQQGFSLQVFVGPITSQEYATVTGLDLQTVEAVTPRELVVNGMRIALYDTTERPIPDVQRFRQMLGSKGVKIAFDEGTIWQCTAEFVFENMNVPYIPRNASDGVY